jgi:methionine-rich copper-binding protein CopC
MSTSATGTQRSRAVRTVVALAAWLALAVACAVSVPPNGGPEDKAPPSVAKTTPANDSTGVDPKSEIRITFSEPMRQERVERNVVVSPPIEFARVHWDGDVLVIQPAHDLVRDTTYVVRIKPDYQDRHNVPGAQWHEFAFATGTAALDTARVEGKMTLKRAPAGRAIARAFRITGKDTVRVEKDRPDRETTADRNGVFSLRHLPSNGARFLVMGFVDANSNGVYDRDGDPALVYPDTITMLPQNPVVTGIDLELLDPKEPGGVKGTVTNESGADSARVMIAIYDNADSTRAAYRAVCDSTGAYEVKSIKPGAYILRAFVDVKRDSVPGTYPCAEKPKGCPEPAARRPGWLRIKAATTATEPPLIIRKEDTK